MGKLMDIIERWSTLAIVLRLLLSMLIGILIGVEREFKNRGAGIKTHSLVCIGSALAMMTSEYVAMKFPEYRADLTRIGAQVVSGVGFLGVGTIIVTGKNQVRGLTTAAGLWVCACAGIATGIGFMKGALVALLLIMFTLKILNLLDLFIRKHSKSFDLCIEFENNESIQRFLGEMRKQEIRFYDFHASKSSVLGDGPVVTMTITISNTEKRLRFQEELRKTSYIKYFEEL